MLEREITKTEYEALAAMAGLLRINDRDGGKVVAGMGEPAMVMAREWGGEYVATESGAARLN